MMKYEKWLLLSTVMILLTMSSALGLVTPSTAIFTGDVQTDTLTVDTSATVDGSLICTVANGLCAVTGTGDITAVLTPGKYLYGGAAAGNVTLTFNETQLNATIAALSGTDTNETIRVTITENRIDTLNTTKSDIGDCSAGDFIQNITATGVECFTPTDTTGGISALPVVVYRSGANYVAKDYLGNTISSSTDAQAVIQAGIDNAPGTIVSIQEGYYSLDGGLVISTTGGGIVGVGRNSTTLALQNNVNETMINITGSDVRFVRVQDIKLDGNKGNNARGHGIAIDNAYVSGDHYHLIRDVEIDSSKQDAIHIFAGREVQVENVHCHLAGANCFYLGGSDHKISQAIAEGSVTNGFYLAGGNTRLNDIKAFGTGTGGGNVAGIAIYTTRVSIDDCEMQDNEEFGIFTDWSGAQYVSIDNCIFDSNGQTTQRPAIRIYDGENWLISNSQFFNREGGTGQEYAVSVGGAAKNVSINNNLMYAQATANFEGLSTANDIYAFNNIGHSSNTLLDSLSIETDLVVGNAINHSVTGVTRNFANGCAETSNASGLYWDC